MASTGPLPLTTARGPLLIRARLSIHDDTDSDISPVYSDISRPDSYEIASDPGGERDTMTMVSGTTALETSSGGFGRGFAIPVAKITGDEEDDGLEDEDVERDWSPSSGGGGATARVISTEGELNFVEDSSDDDFVDDAGMTGKESFFDRDDSSIYLKEATTSEGISWTETEVQNEKLDYQVSTESLELQLQSYSLEGDVYDRNGNNVVYDVVDSNKNSVIIDHSEDKEAKFEPEFDTVKEGSTHSVPSREDDNGEKYGENTLFGAEDANHKLVGAEDGDTRPYRVSKDRGKGTLTADGIYFDEAMDNESSITTINFDEEKLNENEGGDETVEFDPAALAALIRQATGATADATIAITSAPDGTRLFSVDRALPADTTPVSSFTRTEYLEENDASLSASYDGFVNLLTEDGKKVHEKINSIRVKFIRLVNQLGLSIEENKTASELLNRLTVAESLKLKTWLDDAKTLEKAKMEALVLTEGNNLKFSCTVLVIGKTGVGKSALINSIFKNEMSHTDAFDIGTDRIREIVGVIDGVVLRVVDTPGLSTSVMDQGANRKLLSSIKRHVRRHPPDVVLYVDRVDLQTRNSNDIPILTSITEILGQAVWKKVVRALTHAGSAPPEGPSGAQLNYEKYIAQQVHATQRTIHMATQDLSLSYPVALVENHASCNTNQGGERVLPNGIAWRPNLLLLCYSVKIMSEVYSVLKPDDLTLSDTDIGFGVFRLPLEFFLSSMLRSRPHLKLTGRDVESNEYIDDELSDSDLENGEDEYDTLPPFRPLKKSEIEKLSREQKKVYFEEYTYRIKLFENKQRKEAARKSKEMNRDMSEGLVAVEFVGDLGEEQGAAKSVHISDLVLPLSFDGDCPSYRYRSLENNHSGVRIRAVSDAQGWDHDCGLNGVIVDHNPVIWGRFPASAWVQLKKDKEEFSIHLDSSCCAKHGEVGSTLTNMEIQKFGNCTACILHGETKLNNPLKSSTTGGISVAFSGDMVSTGWKIANQAHISKQVTITGTAGMVHAKVGTIYGCDLEAQISSKHYPVGHSRSSIELNLVKLKDILSMGASFKTQLGLSSGSKISVNLGVDGKRTGHLSFCVKSAEQAQIAILGLISLGAAIINKFRTHSSNPSA